MRFGPPREAAAEFGEFVGGEERDGRSARGRGDGRRGGLVLVGLVGGFGVESVLVVNLLCVFFDVLFGLLLRFLIENRVVAEDGRRREAGLGLVC